MTPTQFLRLFRLPFSHGGRNALFAQLVRRGETLFFAAARLHRATLSRHKRVVMVVGTYGKTTTTRAVAAVLGLPVDAWLDTNANARGLVAWSLLRQPPWRRHLAIEAGIGEPGTMRRHAALLQPQTVVVTCIGSEHLRSFRDRDHLRSEKAAAVRALPASGTAILNADDPNVLWMATQTRARILTYGFAPGSTVRGLACTLDWPRGLILTFEVHGTRFELRSRFFGQHSSGALLSAIAAGLAEGVPPDLAVQRLTALAPTPGRMELVPLPGGAIALCDDYKSSLETVHAACDTLETLGAPRKFVVLGGLDSPPSPLRPAYRGVAEHVARVADRLILVGPPDLPTAYGLAPDRPPAPGQRLRRVDHTPHVGDAVRLLRDELRPGDLILVKGRRHQHLSRVLLALQGREVRCAVDSCRLSLQLCGDCPYLTRAGPVGGLRKDERVVASPPSPIIPADEPGEPS